MKVATIIAKIIIITFALIGFALMGGFLALKFHLTDVSGAVDLNDRYFTELQQKRGLEKSNTQIKPLRDPKIWSETEEWQTVLAGLLRDKSLIDHVSNLTGVPARLIIAQVVVEQLRLFNSEREVFKSYFGPLKVLGNQTQFSWGIAGTKEETAREIEKNLKDPSSPHYLGAKYSHLLDFYTGDPDTERFDRIANEKDHYYSYIYTAIYLKQIEKEWQEAGYDISKRPEILSTLFNIGFDNSEPKAEPQV
ncbi:MAG: hypothetical protein WCO03_00325, partial [bacterium]